MCLVLRAPWGSEEAGLQNIAAARPACNEGANESKVDETTIAGVAARDFRSGSGPRGEHAGVHRGMRRGVIVD